MMLADPMVMEAGDSIINKYIFYYTSTSSCHCRVDTHHEMNKSRKLKLKDMKKKFSPLCSQIVGLARDRFPPCQGFMKMWHLIKVKGSSPVQCPMHSTSQTPHHTLLSCTIFLACLTSKSLFFKHSFTLSVHLSCCLPTERLPAHSPT